MRPREAVLNILVGILAFTVVVDNCSANTPPIISNILVSGESRNVEITFDLLDMDDDYCRVIAYYRGGSAGDLWKPATVEGQTFGLRSGLQKKIIWKSHWDEGGEKADNYQIKLIANDHCGTHYLPPEVSNVQVIGQRGNILIRYDLMDQKGETSQLKAFFRTGPEDVWLPATVSGDVVKVSSGPYRSMTWHSQVDLPQQSFTQVQIKLVATNDCSDVSKQRPVIENLTASSQTPTEGENMVMNWNALAKDGTIDGYYISVNNDQGKVFTRSTSMVLEKLPAGSHTFYLQAMDDAGNLSEKTATTFSVLPKVKKDEDYGQLLLVLGGPTGPYDNLWKKLLPLADDIYTLFDVRGFATNDLLYLKQKDSSTASNDISPTVANVEKAITLWATTSDSKGPLFIYLLDHASKNGVFYLSANEYLTAMQLKAYIDEFVEVTGRRVVLIVESCYSGVFLESITSSEISGISSSDSYRESWVTSQFSFSKLLRQMLGQGFSLEEAFHNARNELIKLNAPVSSQNPQLKDSGGFLGATYVAGDHVSMADVFPHFSAISATDEAIKGGESVCFQAKVSGSTDQVSHVWARITPPDYILKSEIELPPDIEEEIFPMDLEENSTTYSGCYGDFTKTGTYSVSFVAKNHDGDIGVSSSLSVQVLDGTEPSVFEATLAPGWSLLSLPIIPEDNTVEAVLEDIWQDTVSVWAWDKNKWVVLLPNGDTESYAAAKGFEILTTLDLGQGFWVHTQKGGELKVAGIVTTDSLSLTPGWNLLGMKTAGTGLLIDEWLDQLDLEIISAWKWENGVWAVYMPGSGLTDYLDAKGFSRLDLILPGEGVWINTNQSK